MYRIMELVHIHSIILLSVIPYNRLSLLSNIMGLIPYNGPNYPI